MKQYEKIKIMNRLSEATIDVLHLMSEYGKIRRLKNGVIVHLVDNQLQLIQRDKSEMYQNYYYVNLFNPLKNRSIINYKSLNKQAV